MVQYKKFQLDSLFDIQKVRGINKSGLTKPSENECYDYITRTSRNNGIESQTGLVKSRELNEAGTFSLGLLQMTFFYRDKPWYAGQFVRKIVPKQRMTREQLLYFLGAFQALRPLLLGVLVRKVDETFSNAKIELPVTPAGQLDFEYMTARICELETQRIRELEAYLRVTGLDDTTLSASEAQALTQKVQWKKFRIGDVFEKPGKGDVDLQNDDVDGIGEYFINSGETNLGIKGRTSREAKVFPKNTITIDFFGNVYYRDFSYKLATHNHVFSFQSDLIKSREIGLYLVGALGYLKKKFSYHNMLTWNKLKKLDIQLPVTATGDIDFDYMQNYIRAMEKQTIQGVVEYKDRVIAETKKVVGAE